MVDFRLLPGQSPERLLEELEALVARLQAADEELEVDVEVFKTTHSRHWELTDEHPVVRAIREVARPVLSYEPEWTGLNYGSRPPLWEVADVIHFGVAGGRNIHAENESTCIDDLVKGCHVYGRLIEKLLT
jgi:acetylornithine deacetylase/succinyl-diaminopimelate desuccinylase-like protein